MSESKGKEVEATTSGDDIFSTLLKPGSSLNPTFLLVLDGAFATLLVIFLSLLYLTNGSLHIAALVGIEFCLWGSVKWYVLVTLNILCRANNFVGLLRN